MSIMLRIAFFLLALFTSSCYKACKLNKPRDISKNEEREVLMSIMLLTAFFLLALFTSSCYKACKLNKPRLYKQE